MQVKLLFPQDLPQVISLFCECFQNDPYYNRIFDDRTEDMRAAFSDDISYCIGQNKSYGIYDEGDALVAFVLLFDYGHSKANDTAAFHSLFGCKSADGLPYKDSLHKRVEALGDRTLFCVSVAVHPDHRRKGLASCLIDLVLDRYADYGVVADVSNAASLGIYEKRGFTVTEIDQDYHLVLRARNTREEDDFSGPLPVLVPDVSVLDACGATYELVKSQTAVYGQRIASDHGIPCFLPCAHTVSLGAEVLLPYSELLKYQRLLNLSQYDELVRGGRLLYVQQIPYREAPLFNGVLREMIKSRQTEWSVVADDLVSIPVYYDSEERIAKSAVGNGSAATDELLTNLDFRTHYEMGVPSKFETTDDLFDLKNRITRYALGKFFIQIYSETTVDSYDLPGEPIGAPAYVDAYVTVDKKSHCAVLSWFSLSSPFLISHYMDNVTRNQIMVQIDGQWKNVYEHLFEAFGIKKRGSAKTFVMIPQDKSVLTEGQIASLLTSETIYPDGENFGGIIDSDIIAIATNPRGIGQYDRAVVYAYDNAVIQFCPDLQGTAACRLQELAIAALYIEWILLEEAAIFIADKDIAELLSVERITDPVAFLKRVDAINDNYSRTIEFWNIKVNYPTSQKSIEALRSAFKTDESLKNMKRNQEQLSTVFDIKCDIIDRKEARRMDKSLAVLSMLAIFSAWIDSYDYTATWASVLPASAIALIQRLLFGLILLVAGFSIFRMTAGHLLFRSKKDRKKERKGFFKKRP